MIERMKRIARNHPVLTYIVVILIMIGEFGCMAYLIFVNSNWVLLLVAMTTLTSWAIFAAEQIRMDEEVKREAYLNIIRRINRLD